MPFLKKDKGALCQQAMCILITILGPQETIIQFEKFPQFGLNHRGALGDWVRDASEICCEQK